MRDLNRLLICGAGTKSDAKIEGQIEDTFCVRYNRNVNDKSDPPLATSDFLVKNLSLEYALLY